MRWVEVPILMLSFGDQVGGLPAVLVDDERRAGEEAVVAGHVESQVDPTTGTALVRGLFNNDGGYLYDGLFVRVRVRVAYIDLTMSSTIFLASANSIIVLSRKNNSFSTPA